MRPTGSLFIAGALAIAFGGAPAAHETAAIDRAFEAFWAAADRSSAANRIQAVIKTGVSFQAALSRVRHGRTYKADVRRGIDFGRLPAFNGVEHRYAFVVPESYDPARQYQVRFHLHGGVGRPRPVPIHRIRTDSLPGAVDEISVFPVAWSGSPWWSAAQIDNLGRILDRLKRTYNVDENRVYLTGTSDGGTGAYFIAFKDTTPWASFLPLIGDMSVLAVPAVRVGDEIFPGNAVNKPFFVFNAGRDRLYPAHVVRVYVEHLQRLGTKVIFRVQPESDHSTAWWPQERGMVEQFVHDHPREPLPNTLSWETESTERFNRAHWLVIDRLGAVEGEARLPDTNLLRRGVEHDFGLRINSGIDRGRRASEIVAGSNAARLGLRVGDTFVAVNGVPVQTGGDIAESMQSWKIGRAVEFVVERSGRRVVVSGVFEPAEIEVAPTPIFPRRKPSGRVDLVRRGNTVEASTQGVRAFTLLLSPSVFDFQRPVKVTANGRVVFEGMVEPSLGTLLKWAARDNDRTMVFGAELNIELGS